MLKGHATLAMNRIHTTVCKLMLHIEILPYFYSYEVYSVHDVLHKLSFDL